MFTVQDDGSPLGIAAQQGHTQTVQRLLEARARVNYQDTKVITIVSTVLHAQKAHCFCLEVTYVLHHLLEWNIRTYMYT